MTRSVAFGLGWLGAMTLGCASPSPPAPVEVRAAGPEAFARFLERFVDERGRVDYDAAAHDRHWLDVTLAWISRVSPDATPERFPREADRLAYWINAYNAWAIAAVLAHHPIDSVRDVRRRRLFFLPRGTGFFLFERITLGGARTSLYYLENGVVRRRFADPRIHFALNCASIGCPRLPREPFRGDRLEEQLARETRRFLAEPRNLRIDAGAGVVHLSSIFDWYEEDFTRTGAPTLLDWIAGELPEDERERLRACADCRVEFVPYDWGLNRQ